MTADMEAVLMTDPTYTTPTPPWPADPLAEPPGKPSTRVLVGPAVALHCQTFAEKLASVGKFDLHQVTFGRDATGPYVMTSDTKVLCRIDWDDEWEQDRSPVEPFGIPLPAIKLAMSQLKVLGAHSKETRFEVSVAADGAASLTLVPPPQIGAVKAIRVETIAAGKWPHALIESGKFREIATTREPVNLSQGLLLGPQTLSPIVDLMEQLSPDDFECGQTSLFAGASTNLWVFRFGTRKGHYLPHMLRGWVVAMPLGEIEPPIPPQE